MRLTFPPHPLLVQSTRAIQKVSTVDQWTTAAQDERGRRKTAEQGAGRFIAKWIAAGKVRAGLRHAVVCPNVIERTKEGISQRKHAMLVR